MNTKGFVPPILLIVAAIAVLGTVGYFALTKTQSPVAQQCTMEARLCPDGSAVGRTGPNCEFAECPGSGTPIMTEDESYLACGCGCCGDAEPVTQCLYRSRGGDLAAIQKSDEELAASPSCAVAGCSMGTLYKYCDEESTANRQTYRNEQYGFSVALPESWAGYTVVQGTREVRDVSSGNVVGTAPTISIRHPAWTAAAPRQDIPIDVYTLAQWQKITNEVYAVSAAPIPPSELGRNSTYVFALPARYNYAYATGWEEVQKIIDGKPLTTFESRNGTKTFCGGIAGIACPAGYRCAYDGTYPDAGGHCVQSPVKTVP
ncbi:MAG: hypothetical protein RL681_818 [Candidatus Parcubacteria bacterium]|jgi:hypothetical protein